MHAHGLPAGASAVKPCAAFTEQAGIDATRTVLASGQPFMAAVAGNDLLALGAMAVLKDAGVRRMRAFMASRAVAAAAVTAFLRVLQTCNNRLAVCPI